MHLRPVSANIHFDWVNESELPHLEDQELLRIWTKPHMDEARVYLARTIGGQGEFASFRKSENPLVAALLDAGENLLILVDGPLGPSRKFKLVREDKAAAADDRRKRIMRPRKLPTKKEVEISYLEGRSPSIGETLQIAPLSLAHHCANPGAPIELANRHGIHVAGIWAQAPIRELILHAYANNRPVSIKVKSNLSPRTMGNPFWLAARAMASLDVGN